MTVQEIADVLNRFRYLGRTDWRFDANSYTTSLWAVQAGRYYIWWIKAGRIADNLLGEAA
jgi:hypothetical protein